MILVLFTITLIELRVFLFLDATRFIILLLLSFKICIDSIVLNLFSTKSYSILMHWTNFVSWVESTTAFREGYIWGYFSKLCKKNSHFWATSVYGSDTSYDSSVQVCPSREWTFSAHFSSLRLVFADSVPDGVLFNSWFHFLMSISFTLIFLIFSSCRHAEVMKKLIQRQNESGKEFRTDMFVYSLA